jgi:hypothetical protein
MALFASFAPATTIPTAQNLAVLARGAILAVGDRTVTACLLAAWPWVTKHWSAYENVLRRARLGMLRLARVLFRLIEQLLPADAVIELVVDETLVRRYGPRVVGVGMHRDAVRSSRGRKAVSPGHKWVVLSVIVPLPFLRRALALPVLSVLYTTPKKARRNRAERPYARHRTVNELTLVLLRILVGWAPERRFRLVGDGAYGTHALADALNVASPVPCLRRVSLVSRFQMDASVFAPRPAYSGIGRPRVKGHRLPSPGEVASAPQTRWRQRRVAWYGGTRKTVLLCSRTGVWYKRGSCPTPVRWVVVRDPQGKRGDQVFFTTDVDLRPRDIVEIFVRRWALETTFQETRRHLGLETLRNRTARAVRRSVPLLLATYSFIVVWFAKHVRVPEIHKQNTPWYQKGSVTFSDMLAAARQDILGELVLSPPQPKDVESKLTQAYARHVLPLIYAIRRRA